LIGTPLYEFVEENDQLRIKEILAGVIQTGVIATYETTFTTPDGETMYYETRVSPQKSGEAIEGLVTNSRDITPRKLLEQRLEFLAAHDYLTNLANRRLIEDQLSLSLNLAKRQNLRLDIAIIDLDNFKDINDKFGHIIGDEVLKEVARRLIEVVRESDLVGRMGGDEFIVLLINSGDIQDIQALIDRLEISFSKPIILEGYEILISASIGISTCIGGDDSCREMLKRADVAMYEEKKAKKDNL